MTNDSKNCVSFLGGQAWAYYTKKHKHFKTHERSRWFRRMLSSRPLPGVTVREIRKNYRKPKISPLMLFKIIQVILKLF